MPVKELKTKDELAAMLMAGVQAHPECSDILDVTIINPSGRNWDAAWTVEDNELACRRAFELVRTLQAQFDLAI
jgi:hypothetical protein